MSYNPITDFLALLRTTAGGVRSERMPGLDFVVSALARAGMITLYVGQTEPVVNQAATAWFVPASPSWVAEGVLFLWNVDAGKYQVATPALWTAFFSFVVSGYSFQSAPDAVNNVLVGTSLLAIERVAPTATSIILPNLGAQRLQTGALKIADYSTDVVNHTITVSTADGSTIMQRANLLLYSAADQLAGVELEPCPELNSWIIAP